jgi:uncharacterized protein
VTAPLRAEHAVEFSYRRSVGGAVEQFLEGLRRGELWGSEMADGRIVVPPVDDDPQAGREPPRQVRVADAGELRSWTWVTNATRGEALDRPFAFALIQLDGTKTTLFHIVDVDDEARLVSGLRVRADWKDERVGSIRDIRAFVPEDISVPAVWASATAGTAVVEVATELALRYAYEPGVTLSGFLRGLADRRIEAGECGSCQQVYVPPRSRCPVCGRGPMNPAEVGDVGRIVSYTVVHVAPYAGSAELPFAWAYVQLDGVDVPFPHLLGDVAMADIAVGQRVQAVWVGAADRGPTWASIEHFRPVVS